MPVLQRAAHGGTGSMKYVCLHFFTEDRNYVVTEVLGYNVNSYDTLDQPLFLTEEIWQGNEVISVYWRRKVLQSMILRTGYRKFSGIVFKEHLLMPINMKMKNKCMYHMNESAQSLCKNRDTNGQALYLS